MTNKTDLQEMKRKDYKACTVLTTITCLYANSRHNLGMFALMMRIPWHFRFPHFCKDRSQSTA